MLRIVAFDLGVNVGWGAVGGDRKVAAGSATMRGGPGEYGKRGANFDLFARETIKKQKPDVIAFASPFVASVSVPNFQKGIQVGWKQQPVAPQNIRTLFGMTFALDTLCEQLGLRCTEWDEQKARAWFLANSVPKGSQAQKAAVEQGCKDRGWAFPAGQHSTDALCIAAYAHARLTGDDHLSRPLFIMGRPARVQ